MIINLTEVLAQEQKTMEAAVPLELDVFQSKLGEFSIVDKQPVEFTITGKGNRKILVKGKAEFSALIPCNRCLKEVKVPFSIKIEKEMDLQAVEDGVKEEAEEAHAVSGYQLDVEQLIYGEILLNWPMKILCKEDCSGICNRCGTNLNHGVCDCDQTVLDPRMAVIRDIFNKEV